MCVMIQYLNLTLHVLLLFGKQNILNSHVFKPVHGI